MKNLGDCKHKNVNVYAYSRWSSDAQRDGDSDRRQDAMAEAWCQRRGLVLAGREKDDGVSAWNGKNRAEGSGLDRLLKLVKAGDYLLVEDNDRLSRQDWLTAMVFLRDIVAKGVIVVTLNNGNEIDADRFRTDPGCFLPAVLRAHLGHDENEKKSKRIKESWAARKADMAKGSAANLHLPCWLGWDEKADKPLVVESNAKTVREMFRMALEGLGCQTIARKLGREGWKLTAGDKHLQIGTSYVWRTLRNKLVIGWSPYVNPPQPGCFPAIVSEPDFYAVQARLDNGKQLSTPRKSLGVNLFTGVLFCSKCGGRLSLFSQYRNGRIYRYYVCSDSLHKDGKCGMAGIRLDLLEDALLGFLAQADVIRPLLAGPAAPNKVDELTGRVSAAKTQAVKLAKVIFGDADPSPTIYQAMKASEKEAAELAEALEQERARVCSERPASASYAAFVDALPTLAKDPAKRPDLRRAIASVLEAVRVDLVSVEETWSMVVRIKGCGQQFLIELTKGGWRLAGVAG
jgi:DNA invertase Pin-like site-specific DNA recombinase